MNKLAVLALAAVAAFAVSGPAQATDLFEAVTPTPAPDEYDWTGFYVGVYVGFQDDSDIEVGKLIGFNVETANDIVFGAEARLGHVVTQDFQDWNIIARLGLDINEGLLLFASAGVGQQFYFGGPYDSIRGVYGAGVEWAASDHLRLRGQVEANSYFGGGPPSWFEATAAAIWNF